MRRAGAGRGRTCSERGVDAEGGLGRRPGEGVQQRCRLRPASAGRAHPRRPGEPGERVGGARVGAEVGGPVGEGVEGILGLRRRPELRAGGEADARRGCARSCGYAAGDEIPEMRARPPGAGPLCRGIRVFRRAGACGARGCRAGRVVWRERLRGPLGDVLFGARCSIRAKR